MKRIMLIGTDEGSFDYNRSLSLDTIKGDVNIGFHVEMVFKEGVDIVTFRVYVRYNCDKDRLLDYNVTLGFRVEEWAAIVNQKSDKDVLAMEEVHRMLAISIGFLRGSLSLQVRTTPFKGAFLPIVDIDKIKNVVIINRLSEEKPLEKVNNGKKG